ncbi:MAG: CHASE3 domain-containing protein, partial [Pyrinomonadaceae bacterium]|nr:CHASE3 domain-containing protein [Sphingobacteriaceae bacterium]
MKGLRIRFLFLFIVVALLLVSLITYRSLNNYMEEVKLIRHSNSVIKSAQQVLSTIKDAEIGYRGFQLTRDTVFLEPYYSAIQLLPGQLTELDSLVAGDTVQQYQVDSLKLLINDQFLIIANILSNARTTNLFMDRYETTLLSRSRKNLITIRQVVKVLSYNEHQVFEKRIGYEEDYKFIAPIALL